MLKKSSIIARLLILVLVATACGKGGGNGADASNTPSTEAKSVTLNADYANALPVSSQLAIGTLLLEDTDSAVTVEQAQELLPNYQMLQALQSSGTAAQAELDAVLKQIQGAMNNEQLAAIKEMQLTPDNMMELVQERGLGQGFAGNGGGGGAFRPPDGVFLGGEGGGGGRFGPGGGFAGSENFDPEEQEAALAERTNRFAGTAMTGILVSLLEARAKGETWEVAAPNQGFLLERALLAAIAEATNMDQQAIMTEARDGKTLREIAEANGADADEILAQAVTAETERVKQAVADGSMEQSDADQWLGDLEARVKELLEQPLQFGGRGALRDNTGEP